ncbi:MAG: hypothetical protein AAB407_01455 [Patescibacteria group bacterium]
MKIFTTSPFIISLFALFVASGVVVYAAPWKNPSNPYPGGGVSAPLNTTATGQAKSGGVQLGDGIQTIALTVDGNPPSASAPAGTGLVTIAPPIIGTFPEIAKLQIFSGNLRIDNGAFVPNGAAGVNGQILSRTGNTVEWRDRFSWMTLVGGIGVGGCTGAPPQECSDLGYTEYSELCLSDSSYPNHYYRIRSCYAVF